MYVQCLKNLIQICTKLKKKNRVWNIEKRVCCIYVMMVILNLFFMEELRIFLNITIQASSTLFFSPGSVSHMHRCLHACVWEAHKCVGEYAYICICKRLMWMLWVFVHHPSPYSTNETGSLSWTQNLLIQLVWFTSLLQGSQLYILGNGMIGKATMLTHHVGDKCFKQWVTFPAPNPIFNSFQISLWLLTFH